MHPEGTRKIAAAITVMVAAPISAACTSATDSDTQHLPLTPSPTERDASAQVIRLPEATVLFSGRIVYPHVTLTPGVGARSPSSGLNA